MRELDERLDAALGVIRLLAEDIGPRRPCSTEERQAGEALAGWLRARGVDALLEEFRGCPTFGEPYGLIFGTALAGGLIGRRHPVTGALLSAAAGVAGTLESDLRHTPISDARARMVSANLVASIAPTGTERLRVCISGHMDSTRSGLMFHPNVVPRLTLLVQIPGTATLALAAMPLLRRVPGGRAARRAAVAGLVLVLAMLLEREVRGVDVPGASDNASGSAVAVQLAAELAAEPLRHTRVDLLITGCEESGSLGAQAYARRRGAELDGTLFLNFDTVGGDVPLTYILQEGTAVKRRASKRLVRLLEEIARDRPELGLRPARSTPGLPTDATVMMARGLEAVTLLAQGETLPNYHWPTDTYENIEPATVGRTLETGREMLARLDAEAAPAR